MKIPEEGKRRMREVLANPSAEPSYEENKDPSRENAHIRLQGFFTALSVMLFSIVASETPLNAKEIKLKFIRELKKIDGLLVDEGAESQVDQIEIFEAYIIAENDLGE